MERLTRHLDKGVSSDAMNSYLETIRRWVTSEPAIHIDDSVKVLFSKATFVMDRVYDDNKMFLMPDARKQDYVIRLTAREKLFFHNKWVSAT